jgi:hypothetical protein
VGNVRVGAEGIPLLAAVGRDVSMNVCER